LVLLSEIVIEVEYSLNKHYGYNRKQIQAELLSLAKSQYIYIDDREAIIQAINLYFLTNIDLVDCILYSKAHNADVATFDKGFKKIISVSEIKNLKFEI